jgi:hypothetical protein
MRREKAGEHPTYIAQEMLTRDRRELRMKGIGASDPRYPDLWDYRYRELFGEKDTALRRFLRLYWRIMKGEV